MGSLLRRIRGALGMGVTWGFTWSLFGFIPRWVLGMGGDLPFPILFGGLGFIAGVSFSVLVAITQGRRRFDQMSLPVFATIGTLGGLLFSALFMRGITYTLAETITIPALFAAAGAASATGSLALARRAARQDQLPDALSTADPKLTENRRHQIETDL